MRMLASRRFCAAVAWLGVFGLVISSLLTQPPAEAAAARPRIIRRIGGILRSRAIAGSVVRGVMAHHPRPTDMKTWRPDGNGARSMNRVRVVAPKLLYSGPQLQHS